MGIFEVQFRIVISRDTIEEVKSRMDIIDVISDFVSLKKSGQNYKALSPFTSEKTASFFVVPAKGIFKDFSSGKGGDSFTFLMEHEGMSYVEAIRYLAKKYGVEIKEDQDSAERMAEQTEREGLYILMNFAKDYYKEQLLHSEEGRGIGLSYFRERGFNDRTLEKFELGYALDAWEKFSKEAIAKGYNKELLEKTGLVVKKDDGSSYDRFRGRVIFPVHHMSGKVIAFGARMLGKDKNQPKYINSPETEIYHKVGVLYGLYQAKNAIRQHDNCYLVEGYTDVISMHQSDVENVVASSGTALTEDQIKLIRRFTENVTVLFDGDAAGIKAALRGIDLILKGGLNVKVALFPDGEDPDSYSRKVGTTGFQKFLHEKATDFISFKAGLYASEAGGDPIRKAESIKEIVRSIALIPDPVKRSVYIQETSSLLRIAEPVLLTELNKLLIAERRKKEKEQKEDPEPLPIQPEAFEETIEKVRTDPNSKLYFKERETIRLMLNYGSKIFENDLPLGGFLVEELMDVEFRDPILREIYNEFKRGVQEGNLITSDFFLREGNEAVKRVVTELITQRYDTSPHWSEKFKIYFPKDEDDLSKKAQNSVLHVKYMVVQIVLEENKEKLKNVTSPDEVDELISRQTELKKIDQQLAEQLGIVSSKY